MENNNSKIIIEDTKNEFFYKKNKSNLNISFNRVAFIFFIFFIITLIYSIHLIHLGSRKINNNLDNGFKEINNKLYRADFVDRKGRFISKTVRSIDIGISTKKVIDKKKLLINLKYIFPDKDYKKINSYLENKKFFYFEKKISEENYEKIMNLGDKSIQPEEKLIRIYPEKNLFSHILGQIDEDNNGISGLEKTLDKELKRVEKPIELTIDKDIQFLIRDELLRFNEIFKTIGSAAILMDVNNGEILSLVSLPDFDLNKREKIDNTNYINRVSKGVYEFGSIFKTFTLAAAFNEKKVEPQTKFLNLPKSITCAGFPIREYDDKIPSSLTAEQILVRSGNIGSVRIAQKLGVEDFKSFLLKLGIIGKINFDIEEVGNPIRFNWGKCPLATASFGHGITTTLLQVVKAYSIIVNGGYNIEPSLIINNKKKQKKKILTDEVTKKILPILRKVVSSKEGTASLANVSGYEIAGKTGTAEKISNGVYSKKKNKYFRINFSNIKTKIYFSSNA